MKSYRGIRREDGAKVETYDTVTRKLSELNPRHDLANHSPDGFEWGYNGSGPAQLALAIVADYTGDDKLALDIYQDFKRLMVAGLDGDIWYLSHVKVGMGIAFCMQCAHERSLA